MKIFEPIRLAFWALVLASAFLLLPGRSHGAYYRGGSSPHGHTSNGDGGVLTNPSITNMSGVQTIQVSSITASTMNVEGLNVTGRANFTGSTRINATKSSTQVVFTTSAATNVAFQSEGAASNFDNLGEWDGEVFTARYQGYYLVCPTVIFLEDTDAVLHLNFVKSSAGGHGPFKFLVFNVGIPGYTQTGHVCEVVFMHAAGTLSVTAATTGTDVTITNESRISITALP